MRNAGLDEAQFRIKTARRNSNNLRYAVTPPLQQRAKRNYETRAEGMNTQKRSNEVLTQKLTENTD